MTITDAVANKGYSFRQHLEEQGWGWRALTVVDLTAEQRKALDEGGAEGLRQALESTGQYSFPATDIDSVPAIRTAVRLAGGGAVPAVVVAPDSLAGLAAAVVEALKLKTGVQLEVVSDASASLNLLKERDVIIIGGSHQNRLALDFALRYQTGFLDAIVPGAGGWAVTTHVGIEASGHLALQIVADDPMADAAVAALVSAVETATDGSASIAWQHTVVAGPELAATLTSWESYVATFPHRLPMPAVGTLPSADDIEGLADFLRQGLDSGGIDLSWYNQAPLTISVECARYYLVSADERALKLFRALLYRMADYYLLTPEGASYTADFDFILGHMVLYYSRLEHTAVFSAEDRLFLANLLLACSRSVYDYARELWPASKSKKSLASGKRPTKNRHNHQTFPARSLLFAHDYFSRYGIADAAGFLGYAEEIFAGDMWNRGKQTENAGMYEVLVYDHGAVFSAFTGRRLDLFSPDALRMAARRMMVITDNFFRPVDCGDTAVTMDRGSDETLAVLASSCLGDAAQDWFANQSIRHSKNHALLKKIPGLGTTGLRMGRSSEPPQCGCWERVPLDAQFIEDYIADAPPAEQLFDKMAFRTGWSDADQFVLLEGVGTRAISHSHVDSNSIVRYNHLGRHWLVSNGYGRLVGVTNVSKSFSSRVLGPDDHNMLVLHRGGEIVTDLPPVCIQQCHGQQGPLAYSSSNSLNYGGVDWNRTVVILANQFLLVVDRVAVRQDGLERAHVEWNCLGDCTVSDNGARLEQDGVYLHVRTSANWKLTQGVADRSADWQKVLSSGDYPYARFPLTKLVAEMPDVVAGSVHTLASLFVASKEAAVSHELQHNDDGSISVTGVKADALSVADGGLAIRIDDGVLKVS